MKGAFKKTERRGLPGGPNEMFTYTTGVFSTQGYKRFSPDVNNPFNIVPSGDITMKDVDFPVHGVDNLGNSQIMYPGNDYKFPGSSVFETPLRDLEDYEEAELTEDEIDELRSQGYVVEEFQEGGEKEGQEGSVVEPYKAVDWKDYHNRRKLHNDSLISHMVFNDPLKHSYNLPEISKEEYDKIKDKAYSKDYLEIIDNKVQKVANPEQYLKSRYYEYETTNKDYGIYRDFKPEFYRYYGSNETRPAEVGVLTTKNVDSDGNILKEYSDVIYNDIYDYAKVPYYKKPVQKILKPDSEPLKEKKVDRETYYYDGSEGPRHDFKSDVKPIVRKRESINIPKKEINLSKEYIKPSKLQSSYYRETPSQFPNVKVRHYNDGSKTYVNEQGQEAVYTYGNFPDFSKSFQYQQGGEKINTLEGDLISKVIMERNRDKEFVKRAFNPEQYPDHIQYNEDGTTSTHRMAWGTDDTGQAYMFPTIFNEANEAIPVPNQYADYISSQGYKNATGMNLKQTGGPVNKIPFEEWYKTVPEYKNDTTSYNLRRAYELAPQEELDAFVNSDAHLRSVYKQPDGIYEFVKRKDHPTVQKELDWFNSPDAAEFRKQYKLDDSGDYYKYLPIQQDGGNIFELPKAQLGLNTPFTGSNLEYERQYVKDNYGNPNKEVADKVLSYMKLIEEADKKQKALSDQRKEEAYLKTYGQPSDNTKVVMPEMPKILSSEEQAQVKAYSEAKKKQQEDFEKKQWEKYEDASTGEKVLDRVQAFAVDPIGMTTRFITGDQAYIPGMGRGLLNYDSPEYENYLRSVGYTPGEIEPSDIQNMINPMYWGASIGNNLSKGDYGNAALEGALTFAPFLPKGTGRTLMNTTKQGAKRLVNNYNQRNLVKNFKNIDPHNYKEYITNYDPEFSRMVTSPNVEFKMTQTGLADDILIANKTRFNEEVAPRVEKILDEKIARSLDPKGKQLIIQNEKEFLKSQGVKDEFLDELAEQAYNTRIKELQYIKNNKRYEFISADNAYAISRRGDETNKITDSWLETYTGRKPKGITADTPIDDITPEQYEGFVNLKKPGSFKEHGLYPRENIGLKFGRYHDFNKTIAHELGHISQANRKLPIEDRLRHAAQPYGLYPGRVPSSDTPRLTFSNNDIKNNYDYFKKHYPLSKRKSDEPYAFAHETKQLLLDHGIIKDWFDPITEKTLIKAKKYFDKNPFGVYDLGNSEFKTGTRMLDFTHPERYKMLAKELNKIAPATIIGTGAAAGLMNNKKTGGEEKDKWFDLFEKERASLRNKKQTGGEMVRDNTYVDIKAPQFYEAPVDNTRVEKKIVPEPMVLSQNIDFEGLKKGIAQAESLGGVLMVNPESTATGLYGQRFSEIEDSYKGTREDFAKDTTYQEELFKKRFYEGLKDTKTTPLQKDAMDLYDEYNMQFEDFPYSYEDIAALSNFLGRQGTREYFGYVVRDGKKLKDVFPTKYGPKAKQANKTPEEYLKITRPYYTKSDGGEILKVYADYINGVLDDTPMYKKGGRIYDKLNRIYYKDAKEVGMSSPNYIMTYLVN